MCQSCIGSTAECGLDAPSESCSGEEDRCVQISQRFLPGNASWVRICPWDDSAGCITKSPVMGTRGRGKFCCHREQAVVGTLLSFQWWGIPATELLPSLVLFMTHPDDIFRRLHSVVFCVVLTVFAQPSLWCLFSMKTQWQQPPNQYEQADCFFGKQLHLSLNSASRLCPFCCFLFIAIGG